MYTGYIKFDCKMYSKEIHHVMACARNSNSSAKDLNFISSQFNFDWIENELKFEFLAYAIT